MAKISLWQLFPLKARSWVIIFARSSVISFLQQAITVGYLSVKDGNDTYTFGHTLNGANSVRLVVHAESFWTRVFYSGALGFSEAYMMGEVDILDDNITSVMNLWLDNEATMSKMSSPIHKMISVVSSWANAYFGQTLQRSRFNAMASYDQSNDLFKAFLSREMMYSCALWGNEEGGINGDLACTRPSVDTDISSGPLEVAQARKIAHVLCALHLQPGARVLEFGTGWGALAIAAARDYGAEVDTLTLSVEQKALAESRIREAGLEGRVRVYLMDYRSIPQDWNGCFDAFVSVEMIEHVGPQYYEQYFSIINRALKPSGATAVITGSTFPEKRYTTKQTDDFMRRYMWPNSALPSATALITAAQSATHGQLSLEGVENHGGHYARTLREWGRRLEQRLSPAALGLSALPAQEGSSTEISSRVETGHTGCSPNYSAVKNGSGTLLHVLPEEVEHRKDNAAMFVALKRKWQYLFAYAGAGFVKGYITCHMLTFTRPGTIYSTHTSSDVTSL